MPSIRGPQSRSKARRHAAIRGIDQVHADLQSKKHLQQYLDTKPVEELPALGAFYCVECSTHYESETNFNKHTKGKPHKRRLRQLKEEPYTQKEAEAAVGLRTDNGTRKVDEEMAIEVEDLEEDEVK